VNLSLDETEEGVRAHFETFFSRESPLAVVRLAEPLGFDQVLWEKLCSLGAPAMGAPLTYGGGGASTMELVIAAEALGRNLAPVPLVEHVAATQAIVRAGGAELFNSLTDELAVATLALAPPRGRTSRLVPAGAVAEIGLFLDADELVALRRPRGPRPHVRSPSNLGCSPIANWDLDDATLTRTVLAEGETATSLYDDAVTTWKLLTAAALNGLGARALDIAVDYVKQRKAFGVTLSWFQVVRHRLADAAVAGDGSRLLTSEAAWARDKGGAQASQLATMAFVFARDTAFRTCREALQFHGGYGVTLEYDIQLFFRRAKAWPLAIGDIKRQYQALGEALYPMTGPSDSDLREGRG
jgi:alkylation response protein AidB-like acyl-CoA dehydrogenase